MKRIVVAIDFSPASRKAFAFAVRIAMALEAELIAVFVLEMSDLRFAIHTDLNGSAESTLVIRKRVQSYIQRKFQALLRSHGRSYQRIRLIRKRGNPFQEIAKVARKYSADLIVTGTRARVSATEALLGSTAHDLIRRAPCPVVAVRAGIRLRS